MFHVYILRCSDNSYYIGHVENIPARGDRHNAGKAAKWTAERRPVSLVFQEPHPTEASAPTRESQLKKWSRAKKEALIQGNHTHLKHLIKSQNPNSPFPSTHNHTHPKRR